MDRLTRLPARPLDDATVRSRLTEAVARDGWASVTARLGLRHVAYLRQILGGERAPSAAIRALVTRGLS